MAGGIHKSDIILAALQQRQDSAKAAATEAEKQRLVIFTLHRHFFAFLGEDIKEILPLEKIVYVPGSPDFICGIINVRGDIESVLNMHRLLGLEEAPPTRQARIVMAETDGLRSGLLVDSVEDVIETPAALIKPPLPTLDKSLREFIVGGERFYRDQYVSIVDVGKIFNSIAPDRSNS